MRNCIVFGLVAGVLSLLVACDSADGVLITKSSKSLLGSVEEVRLLAEGSQQDLVGNVIGGSAVGYLIAGKTGATVGAVAGAVGSDSKIYAKVTACQFKVIVDDKTLYYLDRFSSRNRCALLQKGDKIAVILHDGKYQWNNNFLVYSL